MQKMDAGLEIIHFIIQKRYGEKKIKSCSNCEIFLYCVSPNILPQALCGAGSRQHELQTDLPVGEERMERD